MHRLHAIERHVGGAAEATTPPATICTDSIHLDANDLDAGGQLVELRAAL
jgi:hypothetical protein